jgi:hypothetical protein
MIEFMKHDGSIQSERISGFGLAAQTYCRNIIEHYLDHHPEDAAQIGYHMWIYLGLYMFDEGLTVEVLQDEVRKIKNGLERCESMGRPGPEEE